MDNELTEYKYLHLQADWRYFSQLEALIDPVQEALTEALINRDWDVAIALEKLRNEAQQQLLEQRLRARDIAYWLQLDDDLRKHELTYAGVIER
ncbi:hypothetical protein [Anabaena sp. CCY 9910]|uniref:hypothetical protein n=1 Tax=Anabaena sp. CCY 9910 TaxID=3103870 RepID=UPI0039E0C2EE